MSTKLEKGTVPSKSFKINGLDYPIGLVEVIYGNKERDSSNAIVESSLEIGLRSINNNEIIVSPTLITNWTNSSDTPYTSLSSLMIAITNLIFESSSGELNIPTTAFGEVLTGQLSPQFQISFEYTVDNTEITETDSSNSATVTQSEAMAVVRTGTTAGSKAHIASKRHAKYRAGLGSNVRFTALFTAPVAGTEQLIGYADEEGTSEVFKNGIVLGYVGTVFGLFCFSNDTLATVAQADWDDPCDGTGRSGMTLDQTKLNVFQIQYQYLGAGQINLCTENPETGMFVIVHSVRYANSNTVPSSFNPNYQVTVHVDNLGTTADLILKSASWAFFIEGKTEFTELQQPQFSTGKVEKTTVTTEVAIFTIRNKANYAGKKNFLDLVLEFLGVAIEADAANNLGQVRLVRNATLGGTPSYSDIDTSNSIVEVDTSGTTVDGGKELFYSPLAGKNDRESSRISDLKIILAPNETITVAGLSANSATIDSSLLWKELF